MLSKNIEKLQELSKNAYFTLDDVAQPLVFSRIRPAFFAAAMLKRAYWFG